MLFPWAQELYGNSYGYMADAWLSDSVDETDFLSNTQVNMMRIDSKELKQLMAIFLVLKLHVFFIHKQKAHMDA